MKNIKILTTAEKIVCPHSRWNNRIEIFNFPVFGGIILSLFFGGIGHLLLKRGFIRGKDRLINEALLDKNEVGRPLVVPKYTILFERYSLNC
jgi:hypothetical protein